jgi:hypothetical protein
LVTTIATVAASGRGATTSTMAAEDETVKAAKTVELAVEVRTATAEHVVIWVTCTVY